MVVPRASVHIGLAALALAAASGVGPALAQCRLCTTPESDAVEREPTAAIAIEVDAALDFDRLVLLALGAGSATLRPDGSKAVAGTVGVIGGRAMVGQARVRGEPNRAVRVDMPRRIELHSLSGGRIVIEDLASDLPPNPRLDSTGSLQFRFGGRLEIGGDAEGEYRGGVPITVEYL